LVVLELFGAALCKCCAAVGVGSRVCRRARGRVVTVTAQLGPRLAVLSALPAGTSTGGCPCRWPGLAARRGRHRAAWLAAPRGGSAESASFLPVWGCQ